MNVGDRVRIRTSGRVGTIEQITEASDGTTIYQVTIDPTVQAERQAKLTENDQDIGGGLYPADALEPYR